jgi:putative SOS response-associated peptidase YedK
VGRRQRPDQAQELLLLGPAPGAKEGLHLDVGHRAARGDIGFVTDEDPISGLNQDPSISVRALIEFAGVRRHRIVSMCNLYSMTKNQAAILALARAMRDSAGNVPIMTAIFPDFMAPVVRQAPDGVRELAMLRWGMPCPPTYGTQAVTNIRNTASPHWRAWLKPENRCLVPFTSFCEYEDTKPRKTATWFALDESRPVAFFAGLWTPWHGVRGTKANPVEGRHELFGFLTTSANAEVGAVHPKAMPVILTSADACEAWMTAPAAEALRLQRPLPDGALQIVARGPREDIAQPAML